MSLFTDDGKLRSYELDMETFELAGDRYLLERIEVNHETASGISLVGPTPETTGWQAGIVRKCGNGHRLEADVQVPMFYELGDMVICERFSGREFMVRGTTYVIMNQTQIFGKVSRVGVNEAEHEPLPF